jgi:hypothetical protein
MYGVSLSEVCSSHNIRYYTLIVIPDTTRERERERERGRERERERDTERERQSRSAWEVKVGSVCQRLCSAQKIRGLKFVWSSSPRPSPPQRQKIGRWQRKK